MTIRGTAILLIAAVSGGVSIGSRMGVPTVRPVAGAPEWFGTADLGHPENDTSIAFEDITRKSGLDGLLDCMMGHAAAIGDVDADGFPDLLFGTFTDRPPEVYQCQEGARPDRLLRNSGDGTWVYAPEPALEQHGRSSGAVFADLDNDGDLDLVVTRNVHKSAGPRKKRTSALYRNDNGSFADASQGSNLAVPDRARDESAQRDPAGLRWRRTARSLHRRRPDRKHRQQAVSQ